MSKPDYPVPGFPMKFVWNPDAVPVFDEQIALIRRELERAVAEDRVIVYLSCPISSRGGGHDRTNVEIAKFVENRLMERFGERFWVLNPARFQMESDEGESLLERHARKLRMADAEIAALKKKIGGGDYMRMWTKVLVENRDPTVQPHVGDYFDMYYFLGPNDVSDFFRQGTSQNMTAAVEGYFSRKHSTDLAFRTRFDASDPQNWEQLRKDFFRFYAVKASATFSLGSHDEWNICRELNVRRRQKPGRTGDQIAVFFDGRQVDMGGLESGVSEGYESRQPTPVAQAPVATVVAP